MSSWDKYHLEEVCHKITDGTHKTPKYVDEGIVFLSAKNVRNGILDFSEHKHISLEEHNQLTKRCKPEAGDVMLSKSGSLGDAVVVPQLPFEFSIFESLSLIKLNKSFISPLYLQQYLNSPLSRRYFWSITSGIAVKHLHLVDLRRMPIFVPPLEIQGRIVDFLERWDTAIEKTEALIDAKERQFGWLKSKLIEEQASYISKLGDHFGKSIIIEKGKPLIKANITENGSIPVIAGGKSSPYSHDQFTHSDPCITISASGAYAGYVWYHDYPVWASDCNVVYSTEHSTEYLYFALKLKQSQIYAFQSGGGQPHVYARDLKNIPVPLPPLEEQKRIAYTLNTARQEITLLKKLSRKYRMQKLGLMQKLLSGKWHIKNKEAA